MRKHVMLDIETLDTRPSALVLSIGAAIFDADTFEIIDTCYLVLDQDQQIEAGRTISLSTQAWWDVQTPEARSVLDAPAVGVTEALNAFDQFVDDVDGMWGNGADFDCVIVGSLYASFKRVKPWSYSQNRCLRTLKSVQLPKTYVKPERLGTHHHALDDAVHQVAVLKAICEATGIRF